MGATVGSGHRFRRPRGTGQLVRGAPLRRPVAESPRPSTPPRTGFEARNDRRRRAVDSARAGHEARQPAFTSVRAHGAAEMLRRRVAPISAKVFAPADRARADAGPEGEDRHVLARVVGAAPGRIVAVVGGDDREVARARARRAISGTRASNASSAARIARNVAAVAELASRNRRGWRRRSPPSGRRSEGVEGGGRGRRRCRRLAPPSPVPRWAKMSPILPTVTTSRPACGQRSSSVSAGGGMAKSLRLPVRLKPACRRADEGARDDAADP